MASIVPGEKAKHAKRCVWFHVDGKRRAIYFPAMSYYDAVATKQAVEDLVAAKHLGTDPKKKTLSWLAVLDEKQFHKVLKAGLIEPRQNTLLGDFLTAYIKERDDVQANTKRKWNSTHKELLNFFEASKPLRNITPGDTEQWRRQLGGSRTINENTRRKHTAVAKVFFNAAVKKRLIESNPFADLKATIIADPTRFHYIGRLEAQRVIDACPDTEWRLIFTLARFGGLRCPSEILALRWADVNWPHLRMRVRSSKTAHHVGKDSRLVPIFPELAPYLEDAADLAEPGAEFVITRYRERNSNLRTQLHRIIDRAGLTPWPKTFQNLRSTRQTELAESFPAHVVCAWLGNSQDVARAHYLQVTDEHFDRGAAKVIAENIARTAMQGSAELTQSELKPLVLQGGALACTVSNDPCGARTRVAGVKGRCPNH